jgi:outer membrane protein assembly factor BamD (BamD/ComL family)
VTNGGEVTQGVWTVLGSYFEKGANPSGLRPAWQGRRDMGIFSFLAGHRLFDLAAYMSANRIAARFLPIIFCLCATLRADTLILKSGDRVEGKILSETDTEVTISVQVTPTIKDERVVKRSEITKIEKVLPDEEAWVPLANLAPGRESLERSEYEHAVGALRYFVSSFPQSSHAAAAKTKLAQFTEELDRVNNGDVKLNGQWLSKEKVHEERVQIAGRVLLKRMQRATDEGQLTDAMAIFDQMEKNFPGAASYPEAVELARRVLPALFTSVDQRQAQLKRHMDDENHRMAASKGTERAQLDALIKRELATTDAAITAMERSGVKWFPLQPANARSLTALASRVSTETPRLNALRVDKMQESVRSSEDAAAALASGNFDAADKALRDASSLWSENELAKRLQVKLTDAKKAAAPGRSATPVPTATPKPRASSSSSAPASTANATAPVPDPEQPEEPPLYKKPVFFIALAAVIAFGAITGKMIAKSRAAAGGK